MIRADELSALRAILLDITEAQELNTLLEKIVERATKLLGGTGGGFYLCDPKKQEARCVVSYRTKDDHTGTVLRYGEGLAGQVAQQAEPLIINDYRTWSGRARIFDQESPFRAVVSVPVKWSGQVTGVLHVLDDTEERTFSNAEKELLILFASQAAAIIANANLLKNERKRREEAETLIQIASALTTSLDIDEVLENILTQLEKVVPYDSATIFLIDKDHFYGKAARGLPQPEQVIGNRFSLDLP